MPQQIGLWLLIRGEILKRSAGAAAGIHAARCDQRSRPAASAHICERLGGERPLFRRWERGFSRGEPSKGSLLERSFSPLFLPQEKGGPPRVAERTVGTDADIALATATVIVKRKNNRLRRSNAPAQAVFKFINSMRELTLIEVFIKSPCGQQRFMIAALDDLAVLED